MAELKTKPTGASVEAFLAAAADGQRLADCRTLIGIMREATGGEPKMWGPSIVGFGSYRYRYASGRDADWPLTAFSPRKNDLTVYFMPSFDGFEELKSRLGKCKTGKCCLYLKRLSDVDQSVLKQFVKASVEAMRKRYPETAPSA